MQAYQPAQDVRRDHVRLIRVRASFYGRRPRSRPGTSPPRFLRQVRAARLYAAAQHELGERKQAQEEIIKLNQALEQRAVELHTANKELEAFSYSVSHDLRAPLSAIDNFARMMIEDLGEQLAADGQQFLQLIHENAVAMGLLINDLLSFSRLSRQPLKKNRVAPAELVQPVLADLQHQCNGRHIEITVGEMPPCQADPILLKQVIANLLSNAIKFTRPREVARIDVGRVGQVGNVTYFVRDNGVGFDSQHSEKLFGVFQRLHHADEFEGTGVGLAIVQRIVHRHGGRVWAEAQVDQGATFFFTLAAE